MTVPLPSAFSIAALRVSTALDDHFSDAVRVTMDTPVRAEKSLQDEETILNLYFYSILPAGIIANYTSSDPFMIRTLCLITPFSKGTLGDDGNGAGDTVKLPANELEFRVLGDTIRFFHENPVLVSPAAGPGIEHTSYDIQTILRSPDMEEINHVWTMQGGSLTYQTSVVYEFALIPVDPEQPAPIPPIVHTHASETRPEMETISAAPDTVGDGSSSWSQADDPAKIRFLTEAGLKEIKSIKWTQSEFDNNPYRTVTIALSGIPGHRAKLVWAIGDNKVSAGIHLITSQHVKDKKAQINLSLPAIDAPGDITLQADYTDAHGVPLADSNYPDKDLALSNMVTLTMELAP